MSSGNGPNPGTPIPPARADLVGFGGLVGCLFIVYAAGACRTIYVGDSGELVTAVYLLGIPHPSGYPLYVLLGKLWTLLIPFGSVASRMSLFSAACAATACGVLYLLCRKLRLSLTASLLAATLLAFSPSFWSEANVQRTYCLNALLILAATWLAWRWYESRRTPTLALAFLLSGLGACNHLFMAVYAFCLAALVLVTHPRIVRQAGILALCAVTFLAGLAPYLYLPLRSRSNPRVDWGNPETLDGFLEVVLRRNFWERAWLERPSDLVVIAGDYTAGLGRETAWVGAALAVLGLVAWARRDRFVILPVLVMVANAVTLAIHGSRSDIFIWHRYYIPSYIMTALLAGMGCHALFRRIPRRVAPVALLLPAVLLVTGWRATDRSRYRIAEDFSRKVLESLPPGSHLIATDDNVLFVLMYLHLVEKMRPDVNLILQGVGNAEMPPLRFNPDADPVFFTHHPNWNMPGLEIVPVGPVFRAWRAGRPPPEPVALPPHLEGELDDRVPKDHLTQNLVGQYHYMKGITLETRDWLEARRQFREASAAAPHNDVLFYNLGLIYRRNGLLDDALGAFERSHRINPRYLASPTRPQASDKVAQVAEEKRRLEELEAELGRDSTLEGRSPGSSDHHFRMSLLLEQTGEGQWARGHRLKALELEAGPAAP